MKHVSTNSSGTGSWFASWLVAQQHGTDDLWLAFSDVLGEDQDNYRFLVEGTAAIYGVTLPDGWRDLIPVEDVDGEYEQIRPLREFAAKHLPQLVWLVEGRDIWQVFKDNRFLGNSRLANCSKFLKQQPARGWLEANCDPADTTVYVGIDFTEFHRLEPIRKAYLPFTARAPMCEHPYRGKQEGHDELRRLGILPPRLTRMGMAHSNCGGFCVRAGQGQFVRGLEAFPRRFAKWESKEQELREHLGRDDVAILKDRSFEGILAYLGLAEGDLEWHNDREVFWDEDAEEWRDEGGRYAVVKATGEPLPAAVPLRLTTLRERIEGKPDQLSLLDIGIDADDIGGCGCFVSEEAS